MEQLKFIVAEVNKLCGTDFNMISFDSLNQVRLLQVLCDVLLRLEVGTKVEVATDVELSVMKITLWLGNIKYVPASNVTPVEFNKGLTMGQTNVIYPILEWLLSNQAKVKSRAYLSKFVERIYIPPEARAFPEVQNAIKMLTKLVEDFWSVYNENNVGKKTKAQVDELTHDIKKMNQELNNLAQRVEAQKAKLNNVPNREGLLVSGRGYRNVKLQQKNILQQAQENHEKVTQMEFQYRSFEDKLSRKKLKQQSQLSILNQLNEEFRINKIVSGSQLPQELQDAKKTLLVFEKLITDPSLSEEDLKYFISNQKNEVQRLMTEKINIYSSNDDQLGPFRNQATIIANKKQDVSNSVKELREIIKQLDDNINEKESTLYNLVGGEVLHGDQLKKFIAKLRDKSNEYKKYRLQLQGFSGELGIGHRTLDVLKSIDSSLDDVLINEYMTKVNDQQNESSDNVFEAKQKCKDYYQEVNNLKLSASQLNGELLNVKKETDEIFEKHGIVNEDFEKATHFDLNEIKALKELVREEKEKVEVYEDAWKKTSQDLEKSEYMFNRLLDDMVSKADDSAKETYFEALTKKLERVKNAYEEIQNGLLEIQESKKNQREIIDFLKLTEVLLMEKLKVT